MKTLGSWIIASCLLLVGATLFWWFDLLFVDVFRLSPRSEVEERRGYSEEEIVERIYDIFTKSEAKPLWLDYKPFEVPLVLAFDSDHLYGLFFPKIPSGWISKHIGEREYSFTRRTLHGREFAYSGELLIDGASAVLIDYQLVQRKGIGMALAGLESFQALQRERFAFFQQKNFLHGSSSGEYLDHFNQKNLALIQIEELILADFLNGQLDPERSTFHKGAYLSDFLAVNRARRKRLQKDSWLWELFQQRMAGSAEYVAARGLELLPSSSPHQGVQYLLSDLQGFTVDEEILERTIYSRHRTVGAALCFALDFIGISEWRKQVALGRSPVELLEEAVPLSEEEGSRRLDKVKSRYGYTKVLQQVSETMAEYKEETDAKMHRFKALEGVLLRLQVPQAAREKGSYLYRYPLSNGSTLFFSYTTTWEVPKRVLGMGQWSLSTTGLAIALREPKNFFLFKVEPSLTMDIDGKPLVLSSLIERVNESKESYSLPFQQLRWKGLQTKFFSVQPNALTTGLLTVQPDGKIEISF